MAALDDRAYRAKFYAAVDQRQALDDRQSQFYIPIYDRPELATLDLVSKLADAIDFTGGESVHLVTGFRGTGKTSELLRLMDKLRASRRTTVFMDIEHYFNTEIPLELGAFPVALAAGFVDGIGVHEQSRATLTDRLRTFFKRIDIELSVGVEAGPAEIKLSLKNDESFARKVSDRLRNNRRVFREELHAFFRDASQAVDQSLAPVFIVDSIDHFRGRTERFDEVRESVERVFSELADDLCLPGLQVIYTVPIYVQSRLGIRHNVLNLKVDSPDGVPFEPGRAALRDVLRARAPGHDVQRLLPDGGERLIERSGGLFRDLLRLTGQLLLLSRSLPADDAEYARAEMTVRNDFEGTLSAEQVAILRAIAETHELTPGKDQWSDAMDLMTRGAIMRYPNGERAWYGVHPLLRPLL